ncbi:hypothetical protein SNE40_023659 [Patella caerulea]|uniref:Uncharacterized protein n=1 Tax=Patella caerulea TaxID=87958 RepID=A0AAN8G354_PATCE
MNNLEITGSSANAETIVAKVIEELKLKKLNIKNLVGIGTDGASVMTGKKNGVIVKLRKHSPALIGLHCSAHRLSLAASQAANSVEQVKAYSKTSNSVFHYFSNSALRSNRLRYIYRMF